MENTMIWVSCSIVEFGPSGDKRHLLSQPGQLTTLCGFSASHPEIWRRNSKKPKCIACEKSERKS